MTQLLYLAGVCFAILYFVWAISPKQICSWSSWTPPASPFGGDTWLPPLAKRKQKSCFQPNFTCKRDGESNHRKCHSGLHGTVSLGRALLSHSRAARSRASLSPARCSALSHHLGYITVSQVIACSLLNLLILYPSATPTSPFSPFSHFFGLFYSSLPLFLLYL